ncbi:MAG: hypothetical protein DMD67_01935 [Gemmatimonadetes bacterium]|nr:MAG: hypothetical protein DMD67_01935 [Gemmatimonadota bacterium]
MQGDKIAETSGKVTSQRVLPNPGGGPKMESSFSATGKLLGLDETESGTYWAAIRSDGTLYGEGQGIIMGKNGDVATWVGYRGAVYYQSSSPRWSRLNRIAGVFEYEVDAQGNTRAQIWEWK